MEKSRRLGKIVSCLIASFIIGILLFSFPAQAITLGLEGLASSVTESGTTSFLAKIDLHTEDVVPMTNVTILIKNESGSTISSVVFDLDGTEISDANDNFTISLITSSFGSYSGSAGNGYGYGYDFGDGTTDYQNTSFGNGYGYSTGYGYDTFNNGFIAGQAEAEFVYNITWIAPSVVANSTFTIEMQVMAEDGTNSIRYQSKEASSIIVTDNTAVPTGSITGDSSITYGTAGDVTGSETNANDGGCTYLLYRNATLVSNPDTTTLGAGVYTYVYNTTGCANYSANASLDTFVLTVGKATLAGSLMSTKGWSYTYDGLANTISLLESNLGDGDVTYKIYRNATDKSTGETVNLPAGIYSYILNSTGGENYSATTSMGGRTLTINKATTALNITGTTPIVYGTTSDFTGTNCPTGVTCTMNTTNSVLGVGTTVFLYSTSGNENYTSNWTIKSLTVTQNPERVYTLFNETSPVNYLQNFTVYSNATSAFVVYINGSAVSNNTGQNLNSGTYNFTTIRTDQTNYSDAYDEQTFVVLASTQEHATEATTTLAENTTEVIFDNDSVSVEEIIIPQEIASDTEITLDLSALQQNGTDSNNVTTSSVNLSLVREGTSNYSAVIPANTVITGDATWNGKIILPTIKSASDYSATEANVEVVIKLGGSSELNFSKPVKVVIGGMAGKKAGWTRTTGALTEIATVCNSATNPTNIDATTTRECYIDSGSDLLIWTYHFTSFAAFTPVSTSTTRSSGGSYCSTQWTCTNWSNCNNGIQTRTCSYPEGFCTPLSLKPVESQSCTASFKPWVAPTETTPSDETQTPITEEGLAIKIIKSLITPKGIAMMIIILAVLALSIVLVKRVGKKSN